MHNPEHATDELRYRDYIARVSWELAKLTDGEIDDVDDLPDFDYYACLDDGVSADAAAAMAIYAAGGF